MLKKISTNNLKRKINSQQESENGGISQSNPRNGGISQSNPRKLLRVVTPNITLLTLRRLLNEFPLILVSHAVRAYSDTPSTLERVTGCPLLLQSVLYAECEDRITVDCDLASLQNARIARRLKLASGQDDWVIVLTVDLKEYLTRILPLDVVDQNKKGENKGKEQGTSKVDDNETIAAVNFYAYIANILYASTTLSNEEAEQLYTRWCISGSPKVELECDMFGSNNLQSSSSSGSSSSSSSSLAERVLKHYSADQTPPLANLIRRLLHSGLLLKRSDVRTSSSSSIPTPLIISSSSSSSPSSSSSSSSLLSSSRLKKSVSSSSSLSSSSSSSSSSSAYLFGAPECGRMVAYLREGRSELKKTLLKNIARELPLTSLEKSNLRKSALPTRLHILDLIGTGAAVLVETASGTFIRASSQ
jgi:hypothetical protein